VNLILVGTLALLTYLPKKAALLSIGSVAFFVTLLTVANWFHIQFYQDIIVPSAFMYGANSLESAQSLESLGPVDVAISLVAAVTLLSVLSYYFWPKQKGAYPLLFGLVCYSGAAYTSNHFNTEFIDPLPVGGMHPVAGFVRAGAGMIPSDVKESHRTAIFKLLGPQFTEASDSQTPFFRKTANAARNEQLNIIVFVMESVRSSETGYAGGKSGVTPNLDKLAEELTVATDFYANTTQTVRAEMAILCSALDYNRGAPFAEFSQQVKNNCLPKILKDEGYETHWIHGYEKSFFSRDTFLPQLGINQLHDLDKISNQRPEAVTFGWGISDTDLIDYTFDVLEAESGPFFAEVLTVSNHYPFEWDWDSTGVDFTSVQENHPLTNYHKGIHYTDHAVGKFWQKFESSRLYDNTIVVFVGDHGIWLFDKSASDSPESMFEMNEEFTRVPFLLYVPNSNRKVLTAVSSQLDIAPTLLDLTGTTAYNAFYGKSMLNESDEPTFTIMSRFGSVGYRRGGLACFPIVCNQGFDPYGRCDTKSQNTHVCGIADKTDQNYGQLVEMSPVLNEYLGYSKAISEYSDMAHRIGFTPDYVLQNELSSSSANPAGSHVKHQFAPDTRK